MLYEVITVAEDIEMHESTVSRVTTNKYVQTPQGLFELKYFFVITSYSIHYTKLYDRFGSIPFSCR